MNDNRRLYNRLSMIAFGAFLLLIGLQVNWLVQAAKSQIATAEQNLELLAPDIALKVNAIDHDLFHVNKKNLATFPDSIINSVIRQALKEKGIDTEIAYSIYNDSLNRVIKTNNPDVTVELLNTTAKACLSCIVSFSTVSKDQMSSLDRNIPDSGELFKSSTFQYYSPIIGGDDSKMQLWFSLHQPNIVKSSLGGMVGLFFGNIILLMVLLGLFYYLLRALTKYKNLTQVKEDFFNNMTHEFKTPLSSIRLASRVLQKEPDRNKQKNYLNLIDKESQALEYHIDKILELSLIENDKLELNRSKIDIVQIISNIPQRMLPMIEKNNAVVNVHSEVNSIVFEGDAFHIKNAFSNLVENSLKYGPKGVVIDIKIRKNEEQIEINFKDNGPGIEPIHHKNIFDRFYRGQKENQYKGNGFGIGLSYVKAIIETHNGEIVLDNTQSSGTAFKITF